MKTYDKVPERVAGTFNVSMPISDLMELRDSVKKAIDAGISSVHRDGETALERFLGELDMLIERAVEAHFDKGKVYHVWQTAQQAKIDALRTELDAIKAQAAAANEKVREGDATDPHELDNERPITLLTEPPDTPRP